MSQGTIELILAVGGLLLFLGIGFFAGAWTERKHYADLRRREAELRGLMVFPLKTPPAEFLPCRTAFVSGSVVIGMDYFKTFAAMLRNLVGGRVSSYESLIERARREAILRMKEEARQYHASCVLNIKLSTANIMSGNNDNKGSGCVEVIACGTALIPL